jgi:transcriptional regulator with XRE-family HTH domain
MDVRERVGLNLQAARRARSLSQEELAHLASIDLSYVSGIERGIRNPSVLILSRLAQALKIDIEDLVRQRTPR